MATSYGQIQSAIVDDKVLTVQKLGGSSANPELVVLASSKSGESNQTILKPSDEITARVLRNVEKSDFSAVPVLTKESSESVSLTGVQTPATGEWFNVLDKKIDPAVAKKAGLERVSEKVRELEQLISEYYSNPTAEAQKKIQESYVQALEQFVSQYSENSDDTIRTRLAGLYGNFRSELKAWYGRDDNYSPLVYEKIFNASKSCVSIVKKGQNNPFASGSLIGRNLVLTCSHKVTDLPANHLEVWFEFSGDPYNSRVEKRDVKRLLFQGVAPTDEFSPLDFSIWELEPKISATVRTPLPLAVGIPASREDPIYLIGNPRGGPQLVHDNSWILFPYQVGEKEMETLKIAIHREFIGNVSSSARATDLFVKSYQRTELPGGESGYRYIGNWGGRTLPMIGIECDAAKGDSGAPALLRENGGIVGILVEGQPDQDSANVPTRARDGNYSAGWLYHERLLPIQEIVNQLDEKVSNWRQKYEPTIN